ncbi:MAG: hypothetical protein Q8M76_15045, partial [Spirochaetaceae bacterium]|nr:hypothetical protein [Spirochaetaceae bacterium]
LRRLSQWAETGAEPWAEEMFLNALCEKASSEIDFFAAQRSRGELFWIDTSKSKIDRYQSTLQGWENRLAEEKKTSFIFYFIAADSVFLAGLWSALLFTGYASDEGANAIDLASFIAGSSLSTAFSIGMLIDIQKNREAYARFLADSGGDAGPEARERHYGVLSRIAKESEKRMMKTSIVNAASFLVVGGGLIANALVNPERGNLLWIGVPTAAFGTVVGGISISRLVSLPHSPGN